MVLVSYMDIPGICDQTHARLVVDLGGQKFVCDRVQHDGYEGCAQPILSNCTRGTNVMSGPVYANSVFIT